MHEPQSPEAREAADLGASEATVAAIDQVKQARIREYAFQLGLTEAAAVNPNVGRPENVQAIIQQFSSNPQLYDPLLITNPGHTVATLYRDSQEARQAAGPAHGPGSNPVTDAGFDWRTCLANGQTPAQDRQARNSQRSSIRERTFHPGLENDAWQAF